MLRPKSPPLLLFHSFRPANCSRGLINATNYFAFLVIPSRLLCCPRLGDDLLQNASLPFCSSYDTPERPASSSVFDESSSATALGYLDAAAASAGGRDMDAMCTDLRPGGTACSLLQLKSEPMVPSSPESTSDQMCGGGGGPEDCAGCGRLIQVGLTDIFYIINCLANIHS